MQDISLHIMDIIDNSISAGASRVTVDIREDAAADRLYIDMTDNGRGMDGCTLEQALDPFFTTKPGKSAGIGLSLFAQAARESGGSLRIESQPGKGTAIHAVFGLSHPDRKPLGDIPRTLYLLRESHPEIEFSYNGGRV